jgi:hypothetical protein
MFFWAADRGGCCVIRAVFYLSQACVAMSLKRVTEKQRSVKQTLAMLNGNKVTIGNPISYIGDEHPPSTSPPNSSGCWRKWHGLDSFERADSSPTKSSTLPTSTRNPSLPLWMCFGERRVVEMFTVLVNLIIGNKDGWSWILLGQRSSPFVEQHQTDELD